MSTATFDISTASPAELLDETRYALGKGELGDAAEAFQQYLVLVGADEFPAEAWLARGRIALALERHREARKFLARAATSPRTKALATYEIGRSFIAQGRLEMAVETLLPLASDEGALIPYRCHAYSALGRCFAELGRARAAQSAMEAAGKFGVVSAQLLADDACRMLALGGIEEARRQLVQAAQSDGSCTDAMVLLAKLMLALGRPEEAGEVVQFGLEQTPYALPLHATLARILESTGQFTEAAGYWKHSVMISPRGEGAAEARCGLARCLHLAGDRAGAIEALETGLEHARGGSAIRELEARLESLRSDRTHAARVADFPWIAQRRAWQAPNALLAIVKFHGGDIKQPGVTEQLAAGGLRWPDLMAFLRAVPGMAARAFLSNMGQLRLLLSRGLPVIVGLGNGDGRWVVVTSVDDGLGVVEVYDPRQNGVTELTLADFDDEWQETDRLAVVPHPAGDSRKFRDIELARESLVGRWMEALADRGEGRGDAAAKKLKVLIAEASDYGSAWRALLDTCHAEGRNSDALAIVEAATAAGLPWVNRRWATSARIEALWNMGRSREALTSARRAVGRWPHDPGLRMLSGVVAIAAGHRTRGRTEVLKGLDQAPGTVWPRLELAKDYLHTKDLRWARHHLIAVMELEPDNDEAAALLANMPDG